MEDEDDKIRRNLVALSTIILIAAWLEIPFSAVVTKFVDGAHVFLDPYRLWCVGFALLIYLGLRYRFSPEGARYDSAIKADLSRVRLDMALNLVQRQVNNFVKTGAEPEVLLDSLKQISKENAARLGRRKHDGSDEGPSQVSVTLANPDGLPWGFMVSLTWAWNGENGPAGSGGGQRVGVKITGRHQMFLAVTSLLRTWIWSESSVRHLAPAALSLSAAIVLFSKVVVAYVSG